MADIGEVLVPHRPVEAPGLAEGLDRLGRRVDRQDQHRRIARQPQHDEGEGDDEEDGEDGAQQAREAEIAAASGGDSQRSARRRDGRRRAGRRPAAAAPASRPRQRATASGQRGWKAQPDGTSTGLGGSPCSSSRARVLRRMRRDRRDQRLRIGMRRRRRTARSASPCSTMRPRYITATSWLTCRTTCEVVADEEIGDARAARCRSSSRLTTCAWIETSSAEIGSSHTSSSGSRISARASTMRWRWPPDSSCGIAIEVMRLQARPHPSSPSARLAPLGRCRRCRGSPAAP